jgi:flagellar hook-associated protein 3 FlgL
MRISTFQFQQQAVSAMLDDQASLSRTQQQLATGRRWLTPADDPAAATQSLDLNQVLQQTEQYQRNIEAASARLSLEETTLQAATDVLQRVRELAVRALNDTLSAEDRRAIAQEVRQHLDSLIGLANTRDANGEYLFAGFYRGTSPAVADAGAGNYVYNGDQGQRLLQISPTRQIAVGDAGSEVFFRIPGSGGGVQDVFKTLYDFAASLEADNPSASTLTDIDSALHNVLDARARVGARLNALDGQKAINDSFTLTLQQALSQVDDLDYAEAASRLNRQLLALQAAQQSFVQVQNLSLFKYL